MGNKNKDFGELLANLLYENGINYCPFILNSEQSKRLIELGVPVDSADCVGYIVDKSDIFNEYFRRGETRITAINPRHTYTQVTTLKCGEVWIDEPFPCWSVGRLIDIINNSTKLGYLVLYSSDILIERLIKVIENHSEFNEIDFSKLED